MAVLAGPDLIVMVHHCSSTSAVWVVTAIITFRSCACIIRVATAVNSKSASVYCLHTSALHSALYIQCRSSGLLVLLGGLGLHDLPSAAIHSSWQHSQP